MNNNNNNNKPLTPSSKQPPPKNKNKKQGGGGTKWRKKKSNNNIKKLIKFNENAKIIANDYEEKDATLASNIINKLANDEYECCVCCDRIGRRGKTWNCSQCYIIIHLSCVRSWAETSDSSLWLCPGCLKPSDSIPKEYYCYCNKTSNPNASPYITPHSCGEICGRTRIEQDCTHSCTLLCHPGACPPCSATIERNCFCGKTTFVERCGQQWKGRSCQSICGKNLNCGIHTCEQLCHDGNCDPCQYKQKKSCFCGKNISEQNCNGINSYSCEQICGTILKCNNHRCLKLCHNNEHDNCERLPTLPQICACGKSTFENIKRNSCLDDIPTCNETCNKLLNCHEHQCKLKCHDSPCDECNEVCTIMCRCGRRKQNVYCYERKEKMINFQCQKTCGRLLSCGKHKCKRKCCDGDIVTHRCLKVCNQTLNCENHQCPALCHLAYCDPCPITLHNGVSCSCGASSIKHPVPCGTKPKPCTKPCSKIRKNCKHKCVYDCHHGECPKCVILVEKICVGNHIMMKNIPCHVTNNSCGQICNKLRQCGKHRCLRICHGDNCDIESKSNINDEILSCGQKCKETLLCGHKCTLICHPTSSCLNEKNCVEKIKIYCDCKRLSKMVSCSKRNEYNIECDDICLREIRNRQLYDALKPSTIRVPYPKLLLQKIFERKQVDHVRKMEFVFEDFIKDKLSKTLSLKTMGYHERWVVHQMTSYYGLKSDAFDVGYKRCVRLIKEDLHLVKIPTMLLSVALNHYSSNNADTIDNLILHFNNLSEFPGIKPSDLHYFLKPWYGHYHLNWFDSNAMVTFDSEELMKQAKNEVDLKKVFRAYIDDELESKNNKSPDYIIDGEWKTNLKKAPKLAVPLNISSIRPVVKVTTSSPFAALVENQEEPEIVLGNQQIQSSSINDNNNNNHINDDDDDESWSIINHQHNNTKDAWDE